MQPKSIDIHAHLTFNEFGSDILEVLQKTLDQETWVINIGADVDTSISALEIAKKYSEGIFASVGVHPMAVDKVSVSDWQKLEEIARDDKIVAIGECGLEFLKITDEEKERQIIFFRKHIELALSVNKPLMIHCRDAYEDTLRILKEYKDKVGEKLRGDIHFFAGSLEQAKQFVNLGFTLSFTGVITFTTQYDEVVKWLPVNMIMAETDCPYVSPAPYRGKRNEPLYVAEVLKKMAELRGVTYEEMTRTNLDNARRIFGLGSPYS